MMLHEASTRLYSYNVTIKVETAMSVFDDVILFFFC